MSIVNSNIKMIRLLRDIPVKQAADSLCISPQAYSKIERGETVASIAHKTKLAQCFQVPVELFETFKIDDVLPPPRNKLNGNFTTKVFGRNVKGLALLYFCNLQSSVNV
jgi:transcriptional regulator with XRE-family HTH domain